MKNAFGRKALEENLNQESGSILLQAGFVFISVRMDDPYPLIEIDFEKKKFGVA